MADGGYGRGNFDWPGYFKIMGVIIVVLVASIIFGEWAGFIH